MNTLTHTLTTAGLNNRVFTDSDLHALLDNTPAARYGAVNKALKKEELIKIRRGLYLLTDKYQPKKLSKLFLASRIVPHSYVSLESALSYHGWIPEQVKTVTNILAQGRSKTFATPFGEFAYYQLPTNQFEFLTGVSRIEEIQNQPFLMASPLRALADYVYIRKVDWQGIEYLTNGLRIELEQLMQISSRDFAKIKNVYRSKRVLNFLNNLKKALQK